MAIGNLIQQEAQEQYESAALARATPEEVAEAIAAIEMKREGLGTDSIALGEVINQLSLDTTPEELLTEIKSRRTASQVKTAKPRSRWRKRLAILGILASFGLNIGLIAANQNLSRRVPFSSPFRKTYAYTTTVGDAVINRTPFYASLDDLRRLAKLSPGDRVRDKNRFPSEWTNEEPWQVVPLEDGLHVRGWHEMRPIFKVGGTSVTNSDSLLLSQPVDASATTKTVPISRFKEMRDPKFRLDSTVVDGVTYLDRHGEAVDLPAN